MEADKGGVAFQRAPGPETVAARVREDADGRIQFGWTPADRHLRTVYEIDELADAVVARGEVMQRGALRASALPLLGVAALIAAAFAFWPHRPQEQFLALLAALLIGVPLWHRGVTRAWEAWTGLRELRRDPELWRSTETRRLRFSAWAGAWRPLVAWGLVAMFVATYLAMLRAGLPESLYRLGLVKEKVRAGEVWRLFTCAFLHANVVHLFFNGSAGMALARVARSVLDEARILFVFVVAVLAGSLASTFATPAPSIGASGGILGWGGLLLGLALAHPSLRRSGLAANILRWIVLLVVIGLAGANFIDNAAHAGGLLAGLACGLWFARDKRPLPRWQPALGRKGWAVVLTLGGAAWLWMLWVLVGPTF
jgi:membrane associated rhomboid family serine protease